MEELKAIMIQMLVLQKQQQEQQLQQHEQQLQLQKQQKFFELFTKTTEEKTSDSFTPDAVTNLINKFVYTPDEGITFPAYMI